MTIKNTFCELKGLTSSQVGHLQMLMPDTEHFNFHSHESLIGFEADGAAGTWGIKTLRAKIVSYKDMLSLLGEEGEDLLKGVISGVKFTDHRNPDNSFEHNFEEKKLVPHIHQKEIIAWANGEEIEFKGKITKKWYVKDFSGWDKNDKYRVKSKHTDTKIRIVKKKEIHY
jgi:hypothetical protein